MAVLFHRTLVSLARGILKEGFGDEKWGFGDEEHTGRALTALGVWLTDRPVDPDDGPPGAAVLEVELNMSDEELANAPPDLKLQASIDLKPASTP